MLSLPMLLPDRVVGALNVYAHAKDAFGPDPVRIGELFARPVAVSVHNAQVLAQSQRLATQLGEAVRRARARQIPRGKDGEQV